MVRTAGCSANVDAQYRESEAYRVAQVALIQTYERQLSGLTRRLKEVEEALDIVQHTRTYQLLRWLGRWKFLERLQTQVRADGPAVLQSMEVPLGLLSPHKAERLAHRTSKIVDSPLLPEEGQSQWQSKFESGYAQVREPKKRGGVNYSQGGEDRIVLRLRNLGISVYNYNIDITDYHQYFSAARYVEDFPDYYSSILPEKSLEHYIAAKLLQLHAHDVYIDVASENSPVPEIYQRLFGAKTYKQDIAYPAGLNGHMIGGNASSMPVPDNFATKMALHCSFEHFEGDSDIGFIREGIRVLKPGGMICVIPLYLFEEYVIQTDPVVAQINGTLFENDATVYCSDGWNNTHGRFYDPDHLISRVSDNIGRSTMEIYHIRNFKEVDKSCYVRFAMLIRKL